MNAVATQADATSSVVINASPDTLMSVISRAAADPATDVDKLERLMAIPDDAPDIQIAEMRNAFFAGAQHIWGTIMNVLDPGDDPTPADMIRMDNIDAELRDFIAKFSAQHGIT